MRQDPLAYLGNELDQLRSQGLYSRLRILDGQQPVVPPTTTMLGALYRYLREADPAHFQPMNANFGLIDELPAQIKDKRLKREAIAARALSDMAAFRELALGSRLSAVGS